MISRLMCFSPAASFTASLILTGVGTATLHRVRRPSELLLALVPFLFAAQQFVEGLLWLDLLNYHTAIRKSFLIHAFGIFAGIIWPIYMPVSLLVIEPSLRRRKIIYGIILAGLAVGIYIAVRMFQISATAQISNSCVLYIYPIMPYDFWILPFYVVATCGAFFASSRLRIHRLGVVNVLAFLTAMVFYNVYLVSVWCFFAALVSSFIYFYFRRRAFAD